MEWSHTLNGKQNEMGVYVDVIISSAYRVRQGELGSNSKVSSHYLYGIPLMNCGEILCTKMLVHILQWIINKQLYLWVTYSSKQYLYYDFHDLYNIL